jgi:branched-chain amino acid transport system ATP-binding protein
MLKISNLRAWYGKIQSLFDINFSIEQGEIVSLIGTNGAGKTTTVKSIIGTIKSEGEILYEGQSIKNYKTYQRARKGIRLVPENRGLLVTMTVEDNLLVAAGTISSSHRKMAINNCLNLFPEIKSRLKQKAGTLSGGEQQMLSLARAIVVPPKLLILDEPSLGLAPVVVDRVYKFLETLKEKGLTMLLIEQSIARAQSFADKLCLLRNGVTIKSVSSSDKIGISKLKNLALGSNDIS